MAPDGSLRTNGRIWAYRGALAPGSPEFLALIDILCRAAAHLEVHHDALIAPIHAGAEDLMLVRSQTLLALMFLSLSDLAGVDHRHKFEDARDAAIALSSGRPMALLPRLGHTC
ncbi:MAG: hypothetical protein ACJARE_000844 [Paracoccaceae bacterium]